MLLWWKWSVAFGATVGSSMRSCALHKRKMYVVGPENLNPGCPAWGGGGGQSNVWIRELVYSIWQRPPLPAAGLETLFGRRPRRQDDDVGTLWLMWQTHWIGDLFAPLTGVRGGRFVRKGSANRFINHSGKLCFIKVWILNVLYAFSVNSLQFTTVKGGEKGFKQCEFQLHI